MDLREFILKVEDTKELTKLHIPEWDCDIWIKIMTGAERDAWEISCSDKKGNTRGNFRARLAAKVICDEQGNLLFKDNDVNALSQKSASALGRIFNLATDKNEISEDDIEELEKNSESDQQESSGSN